MTAPHKITTAARPATDWIAVTDSLPGDKCAPILVTNNISARTAFGHMSNVWLVNMLHVDPAGALCAFSRDSGDIINNVTHWSPVSGPTS